MLTGDETWIYYFEPQGKINNKVSWIATALCTGDIDPDWYSTGSNEKRFKFDLFSCVDNVSVGKALDWGSNGR